MGAVCIPLMYITNFLHISQNTGTGEQNQYAPVICMMSRSRIGLIAIERGLDSHGVNHLAVQAEGTGRVPVRPGR